LVAVPGPDLVAAVAVRLDRAGDPLPQRRAAAREAGEECRGPKHPPHCPSRPAADPPPPPGPADLDQHGISIQVGDDALVVNMPEDVAMLTADDFFM
jgi:hypothetical protein